MAALAVPSDINCATELPGFPKNVRKIGIKSLYILS